MYGRQNTQNQNNAKYSSKLEDIFNPHMHKAGLQQPKQNFLVTVLAQKRSETSSSMHYSILMLENT